MKECICNDCANLKSILGEDSEEISYNCVFGFPSSRCETCEAGECEESCEHYAPDSEEEKYVTVQCKGCGKSLEKVCNEDTEGDVFCIDCYLKSEK